MSTETLTLGTLNFHVSCHTVRRLSHPEKPRIGTPVGSPRLWIDPLAEVYNFIHSVLLVLIISMFKAFMILRMGCSFSIKFSSWLSLMHRKVTDFHMLVFYSIILLNCLINSGSFSVVHLQIIILFCSFHSEIDRYRYIHIRLKHTCI